MVVIADDDQVGCAGRFRQQFNEPLLSRVHVLVLVHDQMAQLCGDPAVDLGGVECVDGADDLGSERHEPIRIETLVVVVERRLEVSVWQRCQVQQLVLNHVDAAEKVADPLEQLAVTEPLLQSQLGPFPVQEVDELVRVEWRVGLVPRDMRLQEPEAVRVDGTDEQPPELVCRSLAERRGNPLSDSFFELLGGLVCERECNDALGRLRRQE